MTNFTKGTRSCCGGKPEVSIPKVHGFFVGAGGKRVGLEEVLEPSPSAPRTRRTFDGRGPIGGVNPNEFVDSRSPTRSVKRGAMLYKRDIGLRAAVEQ